MALAAVAFAKATRRRQIMVATSSIGPGATNMVTAAGVALANRLPLLLLSRRHLPEPRPRPGAPAGRALRRPVDHGQRRLPRRHALLGPDRLARAGGADACRSRSRRCSTRPTAGPAFLGLPQDVQAEAYDYPARFFEPRVHELRRQRPDRRELAAATALLREARRPLLIAGGGVHYSLAEDGLRAFAERHGVPVVETMAGKACLTAAHPCWVGPVGVTGCDHANRARRRGRRRAGGRHPPAGLHDRLVDRVRRGDPDRRAQRGALRRDEASLGAARRRCPRVPRRARGGPRRLARRRGVDGPRK